MNKDELINWLVAEFRYPERGAEIIADKLLALNQSLQEAFGRFVESRALPEMEVEGYTAQALIDEHGMNPIAAFLTLDWLAREPEKAVQSLRKGHDQVDIKR